MSDWIKIILALAALVWLAVSHKLARAHEWYEPYCCDERDCRPAEVGEVVERDGGYYVTSSDQHFAYDDNAVRHMAPDGRFHVCQFLSSSGYFSQSPPETVTRCLYVPPAGM